MIIKTRDLITIVGVAIILFALSLSTWLMDARVAIPVTIVLAATAIVAVNFVLFRRLEAWISRELCRTFRQSESLAYLVSCLHVREALPPTRNWAISPDFANLLLSIINESKPKQIMELGSGVSTLVSGYRLEHLGQGSILSLDHDSKYTQETIRRLKNHRLEKHACVCHAPLVQTQIGNETWLWYDLKNIRMPVKIDLLIVDGPPTKANHLNRYPALPLLYQYLSNEAIIVLDDGIRKEEQEIVRRWVREFTDFEPEYHDLEAGAYVLRRKTAKGFTQ